MGGLNSYEYHYEIDDGMLVLRASGSKSAMFYIIASQHKTTCRHWERHVKNDVELSNTHDNPEIIELSQTYTYNGLTAYYYAGNQFWFNRTFDEEYVTPKVNQEWGSGGALDRDRQVAWTIIYGNQTAAM